MEEIKDTVGVDTDGSANGRRVGSVTASGVDDFADWGRGQLNFFVICDAKLVRHSFSNRPGPYSLVRIICY